MECFWIILIYIFRYCNWFTNAKKRCAIYVNQLEQNKRIRYCIWQFVMLQVEIDQVKQSFQLNACLSAVSCHFECGLNKKKFFFWNNVCHRKGMKHERKQHSRKICDNLLFFVENYYCRYILGAYLTMSVLIHIHGCRKVL